MFPLSDFNLVCCALATFSAAVGYKVSQRRSLNAQRQSEVEPYRDQCFCRRDSSVSTSSTCDSFTESEMSEPPVSGCPSASDNAYDDTECGTLKRKSREDLDEKTLGNPDTCGSLSPPKKRCRTPLAQELQSSIPGVGDEAQPMAIPEPSDHPSSSRQTEKATSDIVNPDKPEPRAVPFASPFSPPVIPIPAVKPSSAFTSFAGRASAFALAPSTTSPLSRPIWCSNGHVRGAIASGIPSENACNSRGDNDDITNATSTDPPVSPSGGREDAAGIGSARIGNDPEKREDPLAAQHYAQGTHITVTGEEEEQVRAELKGAKVFIKRGDKDFSDGILGHVKLLSHKDTADERLLFRRETVWKVSMSVRLRPEVHCTFDEDQGVLRLALKEADEREGVPQEQWKQQVVVYALKRGKASKSDFANFAHEVVGSSRLAAALPSQLSIV